MNNIQVPPQSIEMEKSVLGCLILESDTIPEVSEIIKSDDFYREDHKEIYAAVLDLFYKRQPVDIVSISDALQSRGTLDKVGGLDYLASLSSIVPTTANAKYYAEKSS
jgi:replicative DNA helicase